VTARRLLGLAPGPLDPLVAALLHPDPAHRPSSAVEARAQVRALGLPRPLRRPRVPDRVGGADGVPVPAARRHARPARTAAPAWVLGSSFVASGAAASATTLLLAGR
ncbi:MAG: hypothetical protein JWN84_2589, partial [Nocardioides sp.]|nr:hypothetical protein [Nocardioides sp.]